MVATVAGRPPRSSCWSAATGRSGRSPTHLLAPSRSRPATPRRSPPSPASLIVLVAMLVRRAQPAPAGVRRHCAVSWSWSAWTGCCSAGTTPPTSSAACCSARHRCCSGSRSTARCRAATPSSAEPLPEAIPSRAQPGGDPQPGQGRGRRAVPARSSTRWPTEAGLVGAGLALHDRRGPRHRHGRGGRRSPAPTWCWCAAATARCARCAPSSPAPASRSGSSRPAPATCWPATSTSRCSSGPRSTSPSPARTAPSTWSRSAATASRTPTSW